MESNCVCVHVCIKYMWVLELKGIVFKMSYSEPQNYSNHQGQFHQGSWARHFQLTKEPKPLLETRCLVMAAKEHSFPALFSQWKEIDSLWRKDKVGSCCRLVTAGNVMKTEVIQPCAAKDRSTKGRSRKESSLSNRGRGRKVFPFVELPLCTRHRVTHFLEILFKLSHPKILPIWCMKKLKDNRHSFIV